MPQVFISYRRKSWGFTHRLADELRTRLDANIFVDIDSVDQANFEKAIMKHLHESDVVLLVISETTFIDHIHHESDWVRREIREALILDLPLVLVCVEGRLPPSELPEDIKEVVKMQGVNFYPDYFLDAVEKLISFLTKISSVERKGTLHGSGIIQATSTTTGTAVVGNQPTHQISTKASIGEALDALEQGDFAKAIFLLEELKGNGFNSRFVNIDELLEDAKNHQQQAELKRLAQIEYVEIAGLIKRRITHIRGLLAFQSWQHEYPNLVVELDTENFRSQSLDVPAIVKSNSLLEIMPSPFDWINIPAGQIVLGGTLRANGGYITAATSFDVETFSVAKYPLTNVQFARFVEAGGYYQQKWWTTDGWQECTRERWAEPRYWNNEELNKLDYPVVGVSWYEASAFCRWLSDISGENVSLPTEQQWQRAAQGDTKWAYPYGDKFDKTRCNFDSRRTTSVTEYEGKGDSPFGVVDMSGNAWEWCLTKYESGDIKLDGTDKRIIRGGAWMFVDSNLLKLYDSTHWRVDYRLGVDPKNRNGTRGFRVVRNNQYSS
jgi:formylglycine-generating enzyme required for sulfatase activity